MRSSACEAASARMRKASPSSSTRKAGGASASTKNSRRSAVQKESSVQTLWGEEKLPAPAASSSRLAMRRRIWAAAALV